LRDTVDIKDYDLSRKDSYTNIIGVAKHLCGGATDLTLTSLENISKKTEGLAIATCCHHRCDIKTYVNLPFIYDLLKEANSELS